MSAQQAFKEEPATAEFAYQVLQWSVAKIAESRKRKGGIDLRQNLLLANVLCKARNQLLRERHQQLQQQQLQMQQQQQQQQELQQKQQQKVPEKPAQSQRRMALLKRSVSVMLDDVPAANPPAEAAAAVKRQRLAVAEAPAQPMTQQPAQQPPQHEQPQQPSQPAPVQLPNFSITVIPLSAAEAARLSSSQGVVSLHLGQPCLWSAAALGDPARGGCVPTCA